MASALMIQHAVFPAPQGLFDDLSRFEEALGMLTKADGHISSYYGLQVEEEGSKNGYFISVWESAEHHKKFREDSNSAQVFRSIKQAVAGDHLVRRQFIPIKGTPFPALESKNTEFVIITPKDGASPEKVKEIALRVRDVWDREGHTAALSESAGDDVAFLMLVGWDSTAHHLETVKSEPYASLVSEFAAVGNFDMSHGNLKKHV
ncbi:hypothetical protein GYMLUDRAFT_87011 [Collybiopsis luxurians FD-317 M1]|uniref:ABM domain-containing protein n=1 Tax=Collybiopsis luxurians FD-317 M1 TaxID=944289 RepID=A0A0D0BQA5_9AGAR|nr:hypothetical protein GYMLUDRAFT_87011 [Collybiopsis luxurians FD-317 M1]